MKKRLIAALLAVSMLVPSGSALAVRLPEQRTERIYSTSTYINPLYRNEMTAAQLKTTREEDASEGSTQYVTSETELCDQLREDLVQRKSTITLHYQSNTYDKQDAENFFKKAVAHTGKPTEGDYLKWQYAGWEATQSGNVEGNTYYMTIKYTMTWYTTEKQEAVLDAKVKKILQSLKLDGKSDYEKISAIYSYVCSHVTYDSEHDADDLYKLKYTAYAAAINGTCVCQGYSVLLYRLLLEENIDCRFISGTGNGENHSWNIVKLGGKYYNLDATWDAGNEKPIYFLKCNENFTGHVRDSEYKTNAFYRNYPMGDEDYAETQKTHTHTYERPEFEWSSDLLSCIARFFCTLGDDIQQEACTVTVNENGTRTASCTFDGKTYIDQIISDTRRVEDIFTDVPATSWYRDFVQYVYDHALMSGVSETQFQPDGTLTRAQVAQILYNQAENPEVEESDRFTDVKKNAWYYRAVTWAAEQSIVSGYTDGTFRPNRAITRQEFAVMLYSCAGKPEVSGSVREAFADGGTVAAWANDAVLWAYQNGILSGERSGENKVVRPADNATRAQAAVMMMRYVEWLESEA